MSGALVTAADQLPGVLGNRRWLHRSHPFPHVTATDVFADAFYAELAAAVSGLLAPGLSEAPMPGRLARSMGGYDAYGLGITPELGAPLSLFVSPGWRDLVSEIFAIGKTPYLFAGIHHHRPGGRNGFIHDDFNLMWFPRAADESAIQLPDVQLCDFKTGAGSLAAESKFAAVRGAVVIFYLLNDGWQPGDGGETGLFTSRDADPGRPAGSWAPRNNSLIGFECTPQSFHAFLANRRARTSIIMWVHRSLDEAVERYGLDRIERWES